MDVLNTTGGGITLIGIVGAVVFLAITILCSSLLITSLAEGDVRGVAIGFFGTCWFAVLLITAIAYREPIRHEVTLRPGHVIDATKYEIVEQRGKIYVIEEREAAE